LQRLEKQTHPPTSIGDNKEEFSAFKSEGIKNEASIRHKSPLTDNCMNERA